ncbi:MAG: TlpA family protein disulfide reductase [Bacteroidales bacterium]|nr:TlpA family protein disulfide reductase [Bacteroidales bacterium]
MRIYWAFVLGFFILFSCRDQGVPSKNEVIIEGRFIHSRAHVVYFDIIHVDRTEKWDSVILDEKGSFRLRKKIDQPYFLKVYLDEKQFFTVIAKPGDHLYLTGNIRQFKDSYTVEGSPESELIYQYLLKARDHYAKLDSLAVYWENHKYDPRKMHIRDSLDSISKYIYTSHKNYAANLVRDNMSNLGTLFIAYQYFGPTPVLDVETYLPLMDSLVNVLSGLYPQNEHVHHLAMRVKKAKLAKQEEEEIKKRLSPGNPAPNFQMLDKNENTYSLNQFKGKYILLHFWATWSPTSAKELRALKFYHTTYAPRGLVFISVSFDYDRNMWEKVIESEKLSWIQLCDFKHVDSPIAKLYAVKKIPLYYLIDPQGNIVTKAHLLNEIGPTLYKIFFLFPEKRDSAVSSTKKE